MLPDHIFEFLDLIMVLFVLSHLLFNLLQILSLDLQLVFVFFDLLFVGLDLLDDRVDQSVGIVDSFGELFLNLGMDLDISLEVLNL